MPEAIVSRILRLPGYGVSTWTADEARSTLTLWGRQTARTPYSPCGGGGLLGREVHRGLGAPRGGRGARRGAAPPGGAPGRGHGRPRRGGGAPPADAPALPG